MSVPLLEAIADAIYEFEGNNPQNLAYRNRNPGNLRDSVWTHKTDAKGYCVFETFIAGYSALLMDLHLKVSGANRHGLGPDSNLLEIFSVYAPKSDRNDPLHYAQFVAGWLRVAYTAPTIDESMKYRWICALVLQEAPVGVATA